MLHIVCEKLFQKRLAQDGWLFFSTIEEIKIETINGRYCLKLLRWFYFQILIVLSQWRLAGLDCRKRRPVRQLAYPRPLWSCCSDDASTQHSWPIRKRRYVHLGAYIKSSYPSEKKKKKKQLEKFNMIWRAALIQNPWFRRFMSMSYTCCTKQVMRRDIVSQNIIETVSKAALLKLTKDGVGSMWAIPST